MIPVSVKPVVILIFPLIEICFFRWFAKAELGFRPGFPGFTDYELFFPAPLGWFAYWWALEKAEPLRLKIQKGPLVLQGIVLLLLFLIWNLKKAHFAISPVMIGALLSILLSSAFFIGVSPRYFMRNKNRWALIPGVVMVFSSVIYLKYGQSVWEKMLPVFSVGVQQMIDSFHLSSLTITPLKSHLWIQHPLLEVMVGYGCGGFDGWLFFLSAFAVFCPLNWQSFSVSAWGAWLVGGLLWFSFINIIRLLCLFCLTLLLIQVGGEAWGTRWGLGFFHLHAGYIAYSLGLLAYFPFILSRAEKGHLPSQKQAKLSYLLPFKATR